MSLITAIFQNNATEVRKLIDQGNDIHHNHGQALRMAVWLERIEIVNLLIELGADVHVEDEGPLLLAIQNDNIELVKILIAAGSRIVDDEVINKVENPEIKALLINNE
jgi:ankyrin repeat protein